MHRRAALLALTGMAVSGPAVAAKTTAGWKFWPFDRSTSRRPLLIAGTQVMYAMKQSLAQAFLKTHTNIDAVVETGGSLSALIALKRGSVDVAAMSRELKASEDESGMKSYLVARNGVGIVVGPEVRLASLNAHQVRAILAGRIVNWAQVGGPNAAVQVVSRTRGSTARQFVEDVILAGGDIAANAIETENALKLSQLVASTPHAIGFISLRDKRTAVPVQYLSVDGVEASRATLLSGRYPYTQSLYLVTMEDQRSTAGLFVDFVCSAAGQKIIDAAHMVGTY